MGDTDALRDKIAQAGLREEPRFLAIHAMYRIPRDFDDDAWQRVFQGICVLFGCQGDELTCPNEHYATTADDYEGCRKWLWEDPDLAEAQEALSLLRSRVEALADELDDEAAGLTAMTPASLGARGALRGAARRLRRSLSDNKEQQ